MSRQVMLLLPEDVLGALPAALPGPDYATIVEDSEAERVGVRVLPPVSNDDEATAQGEPEDSLVWVLRPRANI
ncbi:hypothetical protein PF010_g17724 [Phytophthora fragariae]|uniref:Uncharacterized protein n=2 Tax=Phytophthora fragariae TaxID=53985 RepID=A0A6A3XXA4_9STRA|nr:hypothetical protein PF010_g17724 [Phytophthora fragariae]KAE9124817.1 hypothetical protein PF006_g17100 [Phytophthora fragariae]KAE9210081.1 hypothetical protein PF002_g18922 [Phytophthora fragariae]KAE9297376.1 hypothetical protein PF001_g16433 [Phytophthora fragariae]